MTCSEADCERPGHHRGLCNSHYARWWRQNRREATAQPCSIEGCDKNATARGWCYVHYDRWRRHGDPLTLMWYRTKRCSIEGCAAVAAARGWCTKHYTRWERHGDPLYCAPPKKPKEERKPRSRARKPPPPLFIPLPGEEWRAVPGYEGQYEVSDLGRVRSLDRPNSRSTRIAGRLMKPNLDREGRARVSLWRNGVKSDWFVHRLVLLTFVGPPPPGEITRHGTNGRSDNSLTNLCYGTPAENAEDMVVRDGTSCRGSRHYRAALTEAQVREIRDLYARGDVTQKVLGVRFGVGRRMIGRIVNRDNWKHVA